MNKSLIALVFVSAITVTSTRACEPGIARKRLDDQISAFRTCVHDGGILQMLSAYTTELDDILNKWKPLVANPELFEIMELQAHAYKDVLRGADRGKSRAVLPNCDAAYYEIVTMAKFVEECEDVVEMLHRDKAPTLESVEQIIQRAKIIRSCHGSNPKLLPRPSGTAVDKKLDEIFANVRASSLDDEKKTAIFKTISETRGSLVLLQEKALFPAETRYLLDALIHPIDIDATHAGHILTLFDKFQETYTTMLNLAAHLPQKASDL